MSRRNMKAKIETLKAASLLTLWSNKTNTIKSYQAYDVEVQEGGRMPYDSGVQVVRSSQLRRDISIDQFTTKAFCSNARTGVEEIKPWLFSL